MFNIFRKKLTMLVLLSLVLNSNLTQVATAQPNNAGTGNTPNSSNVDKSPDAMPKVAPIPTPKYIKKVCMIVVPGLSTDTVNRYTLPNIGRFSKAGILSKGMVSSHSTNLDVDLANLFSGNTPENHQYSKYGDKFQSANLFSELDKFGQKSVVIDGGGRMRPLAAGAKLKTVRTDLNENSIKELFDQYIEYLSNDEYFADILVLPSITAKDQNQQYQVQQQLDRQFARVISSLVNQGIYDYSLVVIAGVSGSSKLQSELNTNPLVMNGPQLLSNVKTPMITIYDLVPTLQYLTTKKVPDTSGLVMWDIIDSPNQEEQLGFYQRRITELSNRYHEGYNQNHQLSQEIETFKWEKMRIHDQQKLAEDTIREKQEQINKLSTKQDIFKYGGMLLLFIAVVGYILEYFILRKRFLMF